MNVTTHQAQVELGTWRKYTLARPIIFILRFPEYLMKQIIFAKGVLLKKLIVTRLANKLSILLDREVLLPSSQQLVTDT
jgi:hypothetical protein